MLLIKLNSYNYDSCQRSYEADWQLWLYSAWRNRTRQINVNQKNRQKKNKNWISFRSISEFKKKKIADLKSNVIKKKISDKICFSTQTK